MENKNVLVIEDNELNRKLVRALLQKWDYNILEAEDAESGIRLAREHRPGLILMDIQLPGMDGLSATRMIKQDPGLPEIPVVALTAHAMEGDREKAMEAGCVGYISKPFSIQGFMETINGFFQGSHERESPENKVITGKSRILIVDDNPLNVKLLEAKLPHEEYEVFTAFDGPGALKKLEEELIDLILLDIMMPGMDGYDVVRRVKKDPRTREIPIIFITALEGVEETIKGLEAGADEFLNKPVCTPELLSRVRSLIRFNRYREQCTLHNQSEAAFHAGIHEKGSSEEKMAPPSILLVEDNANDARMIRQYFNGSPFKIEVVSNGEEALVRAEQNHLDLVLLDILLPGIDGFEVCRRLKERALTGSIQIVVITCLSDLENKIKGLEIGADDYLIKPIKPQELRVRVNSLLRRKAYIDRLNGNYKPAFHDAIIDRLTGLYNRAYFNYFSELEMKRSLRQCHPLSLIITAIDDFKQLKDTLGTMAGDSILKEFGKLIKSNLREVDFPSFYDEERVAILLPYIDGSRASQIAQRVKQVIDAHPFLEGTSRASQRLTISMGVADSSGDLPTIEKLTQKAEEALHQAKKRRREPDSYT